MWVEARRALLVFMAAGIAGGALADSEPADLELLEYLGTFEPGDEATVDVMVGMAEAANGQGDVAPVEPEQEEKQEEGGDGDA